MDLAVVYNRTLDDRPLTLAPSGWTYKNTFVLYDKETKSMWYPERNGLRGISGPHLNRFLPKLESDDTQWKDWSERHAETKLLK